MCFIGAAIAGDRPVARSPDFIVRRTMIESAYSASTEMQFLSVINDA